MKSGHIMIDLEGLELTPQEKEVIAHPQVGGLILFARNHESRSQLCSLTREIRKISPHCLIAVDQEGGRIQRLTKDFSPLPACRSYGHLYDKNPSEAIFQAESMAYLMAQELLERGVDISFAPVLDVDKGISQVISDRGFHSCLESITSLAQGFINGMRRAGMPSTGKHFPGHGSVAADSHEALPIDPRPYEAIYQYDLQTFLKLTPVLDAIMPAHVLYNAVDPHPACFSRFWLQEVLRTRLNFKGVIFSDDLSMVGAEAMGDYVQRSQSALEAGCDMILICNNPNEAIRVIDNLENYRHVPSQQRLTTFRQAVRRS